MSSRTTRQRPPRATRSPGLWQRGKWFFIGGGVAGGIALLTVLTFVLAGPEPTGREGLVRADSVSDQLDFQITLYQGEDILGSRELSFASLLGDKPIVLNYWASNCPPCSAEMPEFQKVYEAFKGRVVFLGLDVGRFTGFGGPEDSKRELRRLGVTYPAAPVPDIETVRRLRVLGLPSTDFITPDGRVHRNWTGILNESKLTELVENLINAS